MSKPFQVGHVVELISGGPAMTVTKVLDADSRDADSVICMLEGRDYIQASWFARDEHKKDRFPIE